MPEPECTCGIGLWFWHTPDCALLRAAPECPECGCTGYHAIGCHQPTDQESATNHTNRIQGKA